MDGLLNKTKQTDKRPLLGTCRCRHKIVFIEGEGWKHYWMDGKKIMPVDVCNKDICGKQTICCCYSPVPKEKLTEDSK